MTEVNDWNRQIIDEFRANQGRVGGRFKGATLLLLHHRGAKSGIERVNPMAYRARGKDVVVFASKAGADTNPDWYHNLLAHPDVAAEIGTELVKLHARVATPAEREEIWTEQKRDYPAFAEYEAKTSRQIPVVILERRG